LPISREFPGFRKTYSNKNRENNCGKTGNGIRDLDNFSKSKQQGENREAITAADLAIGAVVDRSTS